MKSKGQTIGHTSDHPCGSIQFLRDPVAVSPRSEQRDYREAVALFPQSRRSSGKTLSTKR
jgi:hypothetical protein